MSAKIVDAIAEQTNLSKSEIFNIGIDVLAFVKSVLDQGGRIGIRPKGRGRSRNLTSGERVDVVAAMWKTGFKIRPKLSWLWTYRGKTPKTDFSIPPHQNRHVDIAACA
ncbi:HU family DNA-binding protein [Nocardia sp. NBC_01503]|uniref:hypothetical protein n=1 Tax=Nocardia sp. NBC_01503 TaxID=2975997 RepID=UPI002E7AB48B|nr:hypothetical protein [Nocardia sp. NBC_01503]WTL32777.1 HU family DNA-binding protein [Nocardia sp. NBC_01503]